MSTQASAPLHARLSDEFMRRINSGEWPAGSRLPSEAELCREFGTSRGPIRQALAFLRSEGVITGGQGKSPVVRGGVPSQSFSTFNSFTEWARKMGKEPGQRTVELAIRQATAEAAEALEIRPGDKVVDVLRLRLLDGEPAMLETSTFVHEVGRLLIDFDTDSGSIFEYLKSQGIRIHSARHTIDAVAASEAQAEILGTRAGSPLLRERRLTATEDGTPVELAEDCYLPGITNFIIDNTVEQRAALLRIHTEGQ
ncbi:MULTISPECIES: GntR family transcriptional regulator [Arthrobacter]|uniref:GntR family transcriptional regulator n=2 Tax=Arthrobacter TaxID=1663 RepID=A0ABU9KKZ3_9MICC|nr:GntR family transcriptional regulator [Arthrobacter sp. YJM1]MDP5227471.1 GntR family transcriptional regulator [Arthrobacter sp. YJM1]